MLYTVRLNFQLFTSSSFERSGLVSGVKVDPINKKNKMIVAYDTIIITGSMGHKNVPSSESWLVAGPTIRSAFFLVHLHQQHVFSFLSDPHLISTCRTTVFLSQDYPLVHPRYLLIPHISNILSTTLLPSPTHHTHNGRHTIAASGRSPNQHPPCQLQRRQDRHEVR